MLELYDHQKKILAEDKERTGLFLGTGGGKTLTALLLAKGKTLVVCPKQQREDRTWERNAEKFGIKIDLTVVSKEDFRSHWRDIGATDTFILDECHNNLGVQPEVRQRKGQQIPKTSQLFEATLSFMRERAPKRFYPCSATPVTKPMNLWAIATLFGEKWDFFRFRMKYYQEIRMGHRRVWIPKKNKELSERLAEVTKRFGYTGGLNDFFDVPEQTHKTVYIELGQEQIAGLKELSQNEADPLVRRSRQRTIENGVLYGKIIESQGEKMDIMVNNTVIYPSKKIDYILERALEFPKMLIFANYKAQINEIANALRREGYKVVTLTGETKNRSTIIQEADASEACIVVAQSSISAGYELPSFPCVIYASKSWRYVDYEQSLGRVLRANHLKKNLYIHLVVKGGPDEDCHNAVMSGQDFQEKLTLNI